MTGSHYSKSEERLNIYSHALGVIIGTISCIAMLNKSETQIEWVGSLIFGISLILLYTASTLYHSSKEPFRRKLRVLDHAMIYVLIAGTYTPVCLITLAESVGTTLLIVIWSVAISGIILKLFFTGRFDKLSTVLYVMMGWIAVFAVKPLLTYMSIDGLLWLLYGGICYTLGAVIYSIRNIPFNHAIFHFFVLGGSISHLVMIYFYIL